MDGNALRGAARLGLAASVLLTSAAAAGAQDEPAPPAFERPAFKFLRQYEDWSVLRDADPASLTDFWDPVKFVPLSDDGEIWASFGAEARLRFEGWSSFNFDPDQDGAFLLSRALFHGDLHLGEHVRVFTQGKTAFSTDRDLPGGRRALDADELDLEQGFVDLKLPLADRVSVTVRPGRQAFAFGKQRLVSPLPWANTLRRWDGVSAIMRCEDWTIHGFWSQFVPVEKYDFNDPDSQTQFFGVYATGGVPWVSGLGLDLYFLGLSRDDPVAFNGTTGPEDRYTLGGRIFGDVAGTGLDYDLEGAYQFGDVGAGDVSAYSVATELGYKLPDVWSSPRFFVGFDYASGDDGAGGDVETFNQLFPLGHAFLGYMDFVGRQNVLDFSLGASCKPLGPLTVRLAGHLFWRAETADALYNAGGAVVRGGGLGGDREVGQEIDVTAAWRFNRHWVAEAGYSHFFTGDFIAESGPSSDADFVYVQMQYTF